MFGFKQRRQAEIAATVEQMNAGAEKDWARLVGKLAKTGDLTDAEGERLEECERILNLPFEGEGSGIAAAEDLREHASAKTTAAQRERREAEAEKAEQAIAAFDATAGRELADLKARHAAARAALAGKRDSAEMAAKEATNAWERQQEIELRQWRLLGLPDPIPAREREQAERARKRHLQHDLIRPSHEFSESEFPTVTVESIMHGRPVDFDAHDWVPAPGQTQDELDALLRLARKIQPGSTRYVWESGRCTLTPINFSQYGGRSDMLVDIRDALLNLDGLFAATMFIPAPGAPSHIGDEWLQRITAKRLSTAGLQAVR